MGGVGPSLEVGRDCRDEDVADFLIVVVGLNDERRTTLTPTMKRHLAPRRDRLAELLNTLPTDRAPEDENRHVSGNTTE